MANDHSRSNPEKGRKLALFLDGTWNRPYDKTNVFSLHQLADGYDENKLGSHRKRLWIKAGRPIDEEEIATHPTEKRDHPATKKNIHQQLWNDHREQYKNANQIKFYDRGVGTGFFTKLFGGIFGIGLTGNIVQAYRFICRHYQPGDELYIFGFSRGSYTARSLTGVLNLIGVVETRNEALANNSQYKAFEYSDYSAAVCYYKYFTALLNLLENNDYIEKRKLNEKIITRLSQMIKALKSTQFKRKQYPFNELGVNLKRYMRDAKNHNDRLSGLEILLFCLQRVKREKQHRADLDYDTLYSALLDLKKITLFENSTKQPRVKFLGVFDTVGALGIPSFLWTKSLRDMDFHSFHNTTLSSVVQNAFHALAIDEHRTDFLPTLFHKDEESDQKLVQMWFAGAHSNVGGGYEDNFLNRIPGRWMQAWAKEKGLKFQRDMRCGPSDLTEPVVDSRKGLFKYFGRVFRYIPPVSQKREDDQHFIHSSVHHYSQKNRDYSPVALTQGELEDLKPSVFDWPDNASNPLLAANGKD